MSLPSLARVTNTQLRSPGQEVPASGRVSNSNSTTGSQTRSRVTGNLRNLQMEACQISWSLKGVIPFYKVSLVTSVTLNISEIFDVFYSPEAHGWVMRGLINTHYMTNSHHVLVTNRNRQGSFPKILIWPGTNTRRMMDWESSKSLNDHKVLPPLFEQRAQQKDISHSYHEYIKSISFSHAYAKKVLYSLSQKISLWNMPRSKIFLIRTVPSSLYFPLYLTLYV